MADGKVTLDTTLNNKGLLHGIKNIKGALGGLTKTLSIITAAFTALSTSIIKQSVEAYADYQQLTGGVETLFGSAADKVKAYAENAFYTSGLSANEYMETVTSFSASLISSLAGNVEKAAEAANMALVDMSDNANKMGADFALVQNAYQGFAKQNYTMLDNLKLGYGGTKTEMERLIKDANRVKEANGEMANLSINRFSDVVEAIHIIQEEMGIAGATAEEAEKTISGSAKMVSASWKNVLAAMSGGGDLDKAINNLVYSISKCFENVAPVVQRAITGLGQLIERIAPQLVQTVASSLIRAIPSLLNAVYQMIIGLAKGIYQGIVALFTGGSFKSTVTAQLNDVSAGYSEAAAGAEKLESATEAAGKAAKKSLAGFDELNVLSDNSGGSSAGADSGVSVGGGGSAGAVEVEVGVDEQSVSTQFQGIFGKIRELIEPLLDIDINPLLDSFGRLYESLSGVADLIGGALQWGWDNVLVPLAEWTIEDAAPAAIDLLREALDFLVEVIKALKPLGKWLWDNFLQPIAEWTGGVITDTLSFLADVLDRLSTWIGENQGLVEGFVIVIGSFAAAWLLVNGAITAWNAAVAIWNSIGVIATAVTTGFAAAVNFLTSPITLVVAAIGALIAIIALLVKNWDDVKKAASKCWEWIKGVWESVSTWFDENIIQPICEFFSDLWDSISGWAIEAWEAIEEAWSVVVEWFSGVWDGISGAFSTAVEWFSGIFSDAWEGIKSIWNGVGEWFSGIWDGIKGAFSTVTDWFKDTFSEAWGAVKDVFEAGGEIFTGIAESISDIFCTVVNGIIDGINTVIAVPFDAINSVLKKIRSVEIVGYKPFKWIKTFTVPQIPKLAQGAVLPANKPFLAMVGDQRHGTNVEAPLTTIQEAVALVMQDFISSNMAGHETTVAVLREILEAVLGIQIGDDVIASAVSRHQAKMAIVRGGPF